jgi:hypothetical protein
MHKKLLVVAILAIPGLLMAVTPLSMENVTATPLGSSQQRQIYCSSDHYSDQLDYYLNSNEWQFEFTLAECEYTDPMQITGIHIGFANDDVITHTKYIEIWFVPPGPCPDCSVPAAIGYGLDLTVDPGWWDIHISGFPPIPYTYKMWFGHLEGVLGFPVSLFEFDDEYWGQDGDEDFVTVWSLVCLATNCENGYDWWQHLTLEPTVDVQEETSFADAGLKLNASSSGEIQFSLPSASNAQIRIYDAKGSLLEETSGSYTAGSHNIVFNSEISGVYFVTLKVGDLMATKKFVLMK